MSFIIQNKIWLRILILALFIISMLGIWGLENPTPSPCYESFIQLDHGFCMVTISVFEAIKILTPRFLFTFFELIKGNFSPAQAPEVWHALSWVLITVLPFFSSLLLIRNQYSRRLQTINVIIWGLACLVSITLFILGMNTGKLVFQYFHLLWGLWLYLLLALGTIIFEILVLKLDIKPNITTEPIRNSLK